MLEPIISMLDLTVVVFALETLTILMLSFGLLLRSESLLKAATILALAHVLADIVGYLVSVLDVLSLFLRMFSLNLAPVDWATPITLLMMFLVKTWFDSALAAIAVSALTVIKQQILPVLANLATPSYLDDYHYRGLY